MNKDEIFSIIKKNIQEILYDLECDNITIQDSLKEIGANSIDRVDIIVSTMEDIGLKCDMLLFKDAKNIEDIINIIMTQMG